MLTRIPEWVVEVEVSWVFLLQDSCLDLKFKLTVQELRYAGKEGGSR